MGPVEIEHVEEAFGCARIGRIVVLLWRGEPAPEPIARCIEAFDRAARRADGPVGMLALTEPGSPPPPISQMPSLARAFDSNARIQAAVMVLEDRGAIATLVMEAVTAIVALERRRHPVKICADAREAITWLSRRLGIEPEHREVLDAIERVRDALPLRKS